MEQIPVLSKSRFSHSGDMNAGIKNGSCDITTPLLGVVCHP